MNINFYKNFKNKRGFAAILLMLTIIFITAGYILFISYNKQSTKFSSSEDSINITISPQLSPKLESKTQNQIAQTVPELYPSVNWKFQGDVNENELILDVTSKSDSGDYELYFDTAFLEGRKWSVDLTKEEYEANLDKFRDYYERELSEKGWDGGEVEIGGLKLMPLFADGPTSSYWGYLLVDSGQVQEIVLSTFWHPDSDKYYYEVMVSEPVHYSAIKDYL